jgi:hypothetical protein
MLFARKASLLLLEHSPHIHAQVHNLDDFIFSAFHIFYCAKGPASYHQDKTNYIAMLFPISLQSDAQGGLELPGQKIGFCWKPGDAVIFHSAKLEHGTRDYLGEDNDRLMGIFIIQRDFLYHFGISKSVLYQ